MGLLNYTTEVEVSKSIGEIISMLIQAKASAVMQDFDGAGNVTAISFKMKTKFGDLAFRLPMETTAVYQVLKSQWNAGKIQRRFAGDTNHARRVGWRILRHWLEAQLALIEVGMVQVEQIFLPYVQNATGQTLYEYYAEKGFSGLALQPPTHEPTA